MSTLSTLIATSALLIGPAAANADFLSQGLLTNSNTLLTEPQNNRADAYQAGVDKLYTLKASSPRQLSSELGLYSSSIDKSTVQLDEGAYVTIEERVNTSGQLRYIGVVNVNVSYAMVEMAS